MESVTNSFFATGWLLGTPQWVVLSVAVMQVDRVGLQSKLQLSLMPGKPLKWGIHFDLGPVAGGNAASAPTHDSAASPSPLCLLLASPRDRPQLNWNGLFDLIDLSVPKRVLPRSMLQPGLAMEEACELGTPLRDLHRLDKEFQLMGLERVL